MKDLHPSKAFMAKRPQSNPTKENGLKTGPDDMVSTISGDILMIFRKKFHFPNDLIVMAPNKLDRARSPPSGYLTIYEMSLHAGLRFPLAPELLAILSACEVCLTQFSCRATTIVIGLIAFFRERGAKLTPEFFARIGRFVCDTQGRIICRSKLLDLRTKDPPKNWSSRFFFLKNDWGILEKWGKLKDLPSPLHVGEEDILNILNLHSIEDFLYETHFLNKRVNEEFLFKVGLSIHVGRSDAIMLKKTKKNKEILSSANPYKRPLPISIVSSSKKNKVDDIGIMSTANHSSITESPKICIPEEVLNHSCTHLQRADALMLQRMDIDFDLDVTMKEWNKEYVKIKYYQGEYKRRYEAKAKKVNDLENQLIECRTELSNMATSLSLQRQEVDRTHGELVEAKADLTHVEKTFEEKILSLEAENKKLRAQSSEMLRGEVASKLIEDFKKSFAFKNIIQDHVEKQRNHIFDIEVKSLERQCIQEGFIRGFQKGIRLVHRRMGANIDGLSPSQASEDSSLDLDDDAESIIPIRGDSDDEVDIM